jgi:hypothetical protein
MRINVWIGILVAIAVLFGLVGSINRRALMKQQADHRRHLVLVGASIGHAWRLAEWPHRVGNSRITAESIAAWQFDKSEAIEGLLMRPATRFRITRSYIASLLHPPQRPDTVILKECSSYFPGDLVRYEDLTQGWIHRLRSNGVRVVLATVVPVTRTRAKKNVGKQECLREYNRWLRAFAVEHSLLLLDLEAAVRADDVEGYLAEGYASEDGSHLNGAAYLQLDQLLDAFVNRELATSARGMF